MPTCRPRSTAAATPAAARAALAAADAAAVARRRVAAVAADFSLGFGRRVPDGFEDIGHDSRESGRPRLQSRSGWKHFLERGPGNCVQAQDMGFQHVSSCFFVGPILGRTTLMIVLQRLVRPGTCNLAGYHHAMLCGVEVGFGIRVAWELAPAYMYF